MIAYFAWRLVGGVVTLFLAGLLIHTVLWYGPGGRAPQWERMTQDAFWCRHCSHEYIEHEVDINNFDKSWPLSYLAWLFDPSEAEELARHYTSTGVSDGFAFVPRGIRMELGTFQVAGSGALTGNLDYSVGVERGQKVEDVFGKGTGELMLLSVLLLFASMSLVAVQRRRRPHANEQPDESFHSGPHCYSANPTNELFRVHFGRVCGR